MARGRVFTVREPRARWRLMIAEVEDAEGRLVWTDNTRFGVRTHASMLADTARMVAAVRLLEEKGHRLAWNWQGCVDRASRR